MERPKISQEARQEIRELSDSLYWKPLLSLLDSLAATQEYAVLSYNLNPANPHGPQELAFLKAQAQGARRLQSSFLTEVSKIREGEK